MSNNERLSHHQSDDEINEVMRAGRRRAGGSGPVATTMAQRAQRARLTAQLS